MRTINVFVPAKNLTVAQNGTEQDESRQQPSSELDKLLKANTTLAVWLIFLGIGGGVLALYYRRIGYLPEMEWNAALVYLFVCSVWGGVIGLMLTMSLYLPGVIWCDIIIFEPLLDNKLSYYADHDAPSGTRLKRKEPCIGSIMGWLGVPFFIALVVSHGLLRTSHPLINELIDWYWVYASLVLVGIFASMWLIFWLLLKPHKDTHKGIIKKQILKYSISFTLSVFLTQVSMYVIYRLADRTPDNSNFLVLTVVCTIGVLISTHVVAVRHRYYPRQALVVALVTAVLLLVTADRFSDLSMKLMNRYGIGENNRFNLLVKPDLIPLLKGEGVHTCGLQRVYNVEILSKIGDHYFVRVDREVETRVDGRMEITLPKSDVIAMRRVPPPLELNKCPEN